MLTVVGTAPTRLRDGKVDRTRPLCAHPQYAAYKGSGSVDDAANFECRAGRQVTLRVAEKASNLNAACKLQNAKFAISWTF